MKTLGCGAVMATPAVMALVALCALAPPAGAVSFTAASEGATAEFGAAPVAECPAGKHVLGGGVIASGGFGTSDIEASTDWTDMGSPFPAAWRGVVIGFADTTVTTYAACRIEDVFERHKSFEFIGAGERLSGTVHCPRGYRVTGGGLSSPERDEVKGTRPVDGGKAWEGTLLNGDLATDWGVSVLCVEDPFAKHLVYEVEAGKVDAGEQDSTHVDCPGRDGLVSGGTYIDPGGSNLNTTAPISNEGWQSYVDHVGVGPTLHYKTYAICVQPHVEPTGGR